MTTSARSTRAVAGVAAAVAIAVAWVQFRGGIVPIFDTISYWSGAEAIAGGDPFTTTLGAYFSNYDAVEFLGRDGRLPFVDFPVGYPLAAGLLGVLVGVRAALMTLTIASAGAIAALAVAGAGRPAHPGPLLVRALVGVGLVMLPISRLVTQGALPEPLFGVLCLGAVAALLRDRRTGSTGWAAAALVGAAGLVRFVGAALAPLVVLEGYRRHRSWRRAIATGAIGVTPAAANALWAGLAGGHGRGSDPITSSDARDLVRSIAGWIDAGNGDVGQTLFGGHVAAWVWVVAAIWMAAVGLAAVAVVTGRLRWFPEPLALCLAAAGLLTGALALGMVGFDALVRPDNRLMLPAGLLTLVGAAWSFDVSGRAARPLAAALAAIALWMALAVRPDQVGERFAAANAGAPHVVAAGALAEAIVVSNDADIVLWFTGKPSVYLPLDRQPLTGDPVDPSATYAALPCALATGDGAVVMVEPAFIPGDRAALDELVAAGRLMVEEAPNTRIYRPTATACA